MTAEIGKYRIWKKPAGVENAVWEPHGEAETEEEAVQVTATLGEHGYVACFHSLSAQPTREGG